MGKPEPSFCRITADISEAAIKALSVNIPNRTLYSHTNPSGRFPVQPA